jgi:hypothetical protein
MLLAIIFTMKVVGISTSKNIYNPGDVISLSTTVQWGIADTGGVVSILKRAEGESFWQLIGTFDVGSPGLGIPNVLKMGKNETVVSTITAPETPGYYQIGAREQSESEVSASGGLQIQVVPRTPGAETGSGVVHVTLSRAGPDDMLLYVNGAPFVHLPASGMYLTLASGVYMLSVDGTDFKSPFEVQVVVVSGKSSDITLPIVDKSTIAGDTDWGLIAAGVGAVAGVGVLVMMLKSKDGN